MQSIFCYQDYRRYLQDFYTECNLRNPKFSLRAFAAKLELNVSNIVRIINGERNLSVSSLERIINYLKLREREAEYFTLIVKYNQSKNNSEKQTLYEQVLLFRKTRLRNLGQEHDEYFSNWHNVALRELLNVLTTPATSKQLSAMLIPSPKPNEIRKSLNLLQKLGLINKNSDGTFSLTEQMLSTPNEWTGTAIHLFQIAMAELGKQALDRFPKNQRDISTLTLSLSEEGLVKIKDILKKARGEILEIANADKKPDRICQLNFQFFPLSTVQKEP